VHLYNITRSLTITAPVDLEGASGNFGYGVELPSTDCPWGLKTNNTGIDMLDATAYSATIRHMCIEMSPNTLPTSGSAVHLTSSKRSQIIGGYVIEYNTIIRPFTGIYVSTIGNFQSGGGHMTSIAVRRT
jgi:hypothetical protein